MKRLKHYTDFKYMWRWLHGEFGELLNHSFSTMWVTLINVVVTSVAFSRTVALSWVRRELTEDGFGKLMVWRLGASCALVCCLRDSVVLRLFWKKWKSFILILQRFFLILCWAHFCFVKLIIHICNLSVNRLEISMCETGFKWRRVDYVGWLNVVEVRNE